MYTFVYVPVYGTNAALRMNFLVPLCCLLVPSASAGCRCAVDWNDCVPPIWVSSGWQMCRRLEWLCPSRMGFCWVADVQWAGVTVSLQDGWVGISHPCPLSVVSSTSAWLPIISRMGYRACFVHIWYRVGQALSEFRSCAEDLMSCITLIGIWHYCV